MRIQKVTDAAFEQYGRVLTKEYPFKELIGVMEKKDAPADEVVYYPSVAELEALPDVKRVESSLFGGLPIQVGYCSGSNQKLNAVEYHRSSEFGVAVTDLILLLGKQQDIELDYTYDSSKIEAFLVAAGEVVEMYATTLHYAPCGVGGARFCNVVILPRGTNTDIEGTKSEMGEDALMTAKNKWLIAHSEAEIAGAFNGLKGKNLSV